MSLLKHDEPVEAKPSVAAEQGEQKRAKKEKAPAFHGEIENSVLTLHIGSASHELTPEDVLYLNRIARKAL